VAKWQRVVNTVEVADCNFRVTVRSGGADDDLRGAIWGADVLLVSRRARQPLRGGAGAARKLGGDRSDGLLPRRLRV